MTTPPRFRLPGDGRLVLAAATLAPLADLRIGDAAVGVEPDGTERTCRVVGVALEETAAGTDVVDRDDATGAVTITTCTGPYDATTGRYARRLRIELRPASG